MLRKARYKSIVALALILTPMLFHAFENQPENQAPIPFCIDPDWMPYEGMLNGNHVGLSADFLNLLQNYTGLKFELIPTNSWAQTLSYLEQHKCWFTPMLNYSSEREQYLSFTDVYYRSPNILVSNRQHATLISFEDIEQQTLAVVEGYRITEYIEKYYPELNIRYVRDETQGLSEVASGEADYFVGSLLSLNARIQDNSLSNVFIAGWLAISDELRVGVSKGQTWLVAEFNQAIGQITEQQKVELLKKWHNTQIVLKEDHTLLLQFLIIVALMVTFMIWRHRQVLQFNKELTDKNSELLGLTHQLEKSNERFQYLSFHDSLTGLYNRHYFMHHIEDEIHHLSRHFVPTCLMEVDIDYFKNINDKHGHNTGDRVLGQFAKLLQSLARESDISARWGGEEFIFLLRDTTAYDASLLAKRIHEELESHKFTHDIQLTASIGVSEYNFDDSFSSWFERTDSALYQAKNRGRNQTQFDNSLN